MGSRFRDTGGPYLYAREAFGPVVGFEAGWLMWLARVSGFAANCNLLVGYARLFLAGDRFGRRAECISLRGSCLADGHQYHWGPQCHAGEQCLHRWKADSDCTVHRGGIMVCRLGTLCVRTPRRAIPQFSTSVLLLVYAFTGFEMAVIPGGEIRDPQRNIPRALLTAIAGSP